MKLLPGEYRFHADPGHAWLEVGHAELVELGIANVISSYSYMKDDRVFLEEDCDASCFVKAKKQRGETIEFVGNYENGESVIRRYRRYSFG